MMIAYINDRNAIHSASPCDGGTDGGDWLPEHAEFG